MKGIVLDNNYELKIELERAGNGLITQGLVVGNIDYQRCSLIIEAQKGEFKEYPTLGFGVDNYLKGMRPKQHFVNELTKELKSDGMNARIIVGSDLMQFEVEL